MSTLQGVASHMLPIPKRPTLYALAAISNGRWSLLYGGCPRDFIVNSQQKLYPGSLLVEVPGEEQPAAPAAGEEPAP